MYTSSQILVILDLVFQRPQTAQVDQIRFIRKYHLLKVYSALEVSHTRVIFPVLQGKMVISALIAQASKLEFNTVTVLEGAWNEIPDMPAMEELTKKKVSFSGSMHDSH